MYSFRPLSGSYISQLSLDVAHATVCRSFRPLSGSYISQSVKVIVLTGSVTVSVPYRGATFLNLLRSYCCEQMQTRFRPLSGSYISQWLPVVSFLPEYGFPSPIGELHFSILINLYADGTIVTSFPSPIGELHFSIEITKDSK